MLIKKIKTIIFLGIFFLSANLYAQDWSGWKNIHSTAWATLEARQNWDNLCRYAKSMGYNTVGISGESFANVSSATYKTGLNWHMMDPIINRYLYSHLPGSYTATGSSVGDITYHEYSQAEKDFYNKYMMWGTSTEGVFPNHLISGYWFSGNNFTCRWDLQQQAVIDYIVPLTVQIIGSFTTSSFNFVGVGFDTPDLRGVFGSWSGSLNVSVSLSSLTGTNSSVLHGTITHEYASYTEGRAAYYKELMKQLRIVYGTDTVKVIHQPGHIYKANPAIQEDDWLWTQAQRTDWNQLNVDLFIVENDTHESFLSSMIDSGTIPCHYDQRGSSYHTNFDESTMRKVATQAGTAGCWFCWWGRVAGGEQTYNAITQVPHRSQLIRWIPNQDNMAQIGTTSRSAGNEYGTISYRCNYSDGYPRSVINSRIMYSRPYWDSSKIYVAVGTTTGTITINSINTGLIRANHVNEYFEPVSTSTALGDFVVSGDTISFKSTATIDSGSWTGYILEVGTKGVSRCVY